ncbi:DNA glycosylase AlkZ-like family protein [Schumannella soli]|uniref:Winged helix-turn-helix domain-containing protein n=1 Tax=Schumannella soli TaxID=2590779 RepID=A0A506XV28_9MICO|nr:crosslink repair DNA glycosylase YcaQ family protein [Schumannella soli]TPW73996.1 winged helix-turn-helix domain-containing protein [Schumannella soli]
MALRLSKQEARRLAVRGARLDADLDSAPADVVELATAVAGLRVELTGIVAPAAEHVAYTRLGPGADADELARALASGRLFERNWVLRPMRDLGLYLAGMRSWLERAGARDWVEANDGFRRTILDRIGDEGPLTSREVPDESVVPWPSSGWTNDRNVTKMLECLHGAGELAVVGRVGRLRVWDLAQNVFPSVAATPLDEARRIRSAQLMRAFGVARDSIAIVPTELHGFHREVGELATIDDVPGRWRVDVELLDELRSAGADAELAERTVLLSPFDRLLSDRERVARLFEFDYTLEMYKPKRTRRWGAFALPILRGDRLIGKVDARSDRDAGLLRVHAIHEDEPFAADVRRDVDAEIDRFARWMGLAVARD